MLDTSYTTIGREFHPGRMVRIYCETDADCLDQNASCLKDRYRIIYIKDGYGVFRNGDKCQIITSPAVLCLNEKDDAELHDTAGLKLDIMYFDPICFERYVAYESLEDWKNSLEDDAWFFSPFFHRTDTYIGACTIGQSLGNRVQQLISITNSVLKEQNDHFWPCRSRSYFIELLLLVNSVYNEGGSYEKVFTGCMTDEIRELVNWLHLHYIDKITMDNITKQFHTNKTTLNQKFKAVMGITVMEYMNRLRMQMACSLLRKTYLSIKEIRERSGFRDETHFLRSFKKYAGCSPSGYRNQYSSDRHMVIF